MIPETNVSGSVEKDSNSIFLFGIGATNVVEYSYPSYCGGARGIEIRDRHQRGVYLFSDYQVEQLRDFLSEYLAKKDSFRTFEEEMDLFKYGEQNAGNNVD